MSLNKEAFEHSREQLKNLNKRADALFVKLGLPLENKVQMDHYGRAYLFGVLVTDKTTDDELTQIIKATPKKSWDGKINFFGQWS